MATGERILLQSAPVDPRDIFRGDYVTLSYDGSTIDLDRAGIRGDIRRNDRNLGGSAKRGRRDVPHGVREPTASAGGEGPSGAGDPREREGRPLRGRPPDGRAGERTFEPAWFSFREGDR